MKAGCIPALASCTGLLPLAYCITGSASNVLSFQLAPGIGTRRCRRQPKVSSSTLQHLVRCNDRIGAVSCSDRSRGGGHSATTLQQRWRQAGKGKGPRSQLERRLPSCCPSAADGRIAGPDGSLSAGSMFPNRPPPSSTAAKDSPRAVRREDGEPVLGGAGGSKGGVFDWDGNIYSRWEQQQQQQQQQDRGVVATSRASGGRVKKEVWRQGSPRSWNPRIHTAVRINGGGSASGGSGRNRPASLPWPPRTHRRRHSSKQPQQHASIGCLLHRSTGGARGRRGTALSMATSTGGSGADSSFPLRGLGDTKRPPKEESPAARPAESRSACESMTSAISTDELASPPPPDQAAVAMENPKSRSTTAVEEGIDMTSGLPVAPAQPRKEVRANKSTALMPEQDGQTGKLATSGEGGGDFVEEDFDGPIAESYARGRWLLGLLVLQSSSSFVLDHYQDLLREHVVVTLFLTMLVGAGGNAGNQSAIKVIRGLATGRFTPHAACALRVIGDQAIVGILLGTALAAGGFVRVWVTEGTTLRDASAISSSLFLIVMSSVLLGSALPFGFARAGVDPANAGTTIQVAMDIVGVAVTCVTCSLVLTQLDQVLTLPL